MGQGVGRKLFDHCLSQCRARGISNFSFVTSPHAVGIYGKVGAQVVGEVPSSIDGRPIPRMDE